MPCCNVLTRSLRRMKRDELLIVPSCSSILAHDLALYLEAVIAVNEKLVISLDARSSPGNGGQRVLEMEQGSCRLLPR